MPVEFIGHRGAPDDAPENTLSSFRAAFRHGADAVELDVHLSKDGQLVVIHDPSTARVAGPPDLKVADLTVAELRQFDVGWQGFPERIPLLEEVIPLVPDGKRLFIETKIGREFIVPFGRLLGRTGAGPAKFVLIGFDYETMRQVRTEFPKVAVLWLSSRRRSTTSGMRLEDLIRSAREANFDGLDLEQGFPITKAFADEVHAEGLKLYVWTVDNPAVARRLVNAEVDGITSNRAAWLRGRLVA